MEGKIIIDLKNVMASIDENLKALKDGIDPTQLSQEEKNELLNDLDDLEQLAKSVKEALKQSK